MHKTRSRVLFSLLGRPASVLVSSLLVFGLLLFATAFAQEAPTTTFEFSITEPGQSASQVVTSSMSALTDVTNVSLCVPQCASSTQTTKPGGTLTLADGATWKIAQSGSRSCVQDESSFGTALSVQSHEVNSLSVSIGGQLAKTVSTGFGVMVPQLRFEFESENEIRKDGITASFSADPESTPFILVGRDRDSSFANIGLGTSVLFRNGKSGYIFLRNPGCA